MKKTEENVTAEEESVKEAPASPGEQGADALMNAYSQLEAKLEALEKELASMRREREASPPEGTEKKETSSEELYKAVLKDEGARSRVLSDYLQSLKGVPLLAGTGAGVSAPAFRPKTIAEAGKLALGYFKSKK